jgi:hypothetical protein
MIVKFYKDLPDSFEVQNGISGNIPAIVDCNTDICPDDTWVSMSFQDYCEYLESIKIDLENWRNIQESISEITE